MKRRLASSSALGLTATAVSNVETDEFAATNGIHSVHNVPLFIGVGRMLILKVRTSIEPMIDGSDEK